MKTKNTYPPAYTTPRQIVDCIAGLLGVKPEECSAELRLAIGWNGEKYITSTDWHVEYPEGKCIFPTCAAPQHKTFIAAVSGRIMVEGKGLRPLCSPEAFPSSGDKVVFSDGTYPRFCFKPGEPLEIPFDERSCVIFSDCAVTMEQNGLSRVFTVQNGPGTVYARFVNGVLTK